MHKSLSTIFICLLLWGLLVFVDRTIIGATYPYLVNDNETGWFSFGLNWLTFDAKVWHHHPSPTINMVSGLIVTILGVDNSELSLEKFINVSIAIQGIIIIIAAAWFHWISNVLRISVVDRFVIGIGAICFPTLLIYVGHWGNYFSIGLLGIPLGMSLLAALEGHKQSAKAGGIGCGLLTANFYPSALITIVFFALLLIKRYRKIFQSHAKLKKTKWLSIRELFIIVLLLICVISWSLVLFSRVDISEIYRSQEIFYFLGLVGLFVISIYLFMICSRKDELSANFILWFVATFVIANFILLPWYFVGVSDAVMRSTGADKSLESFVNALEYSPWLWVLVFSFFSLGCSSVALMWKNVMAPAEIITNYHAIVFSILVIMIVPFMSASELRTGNVPGMSERVFVTLIPALSVSWVIIFRVLRGWLGWLWRLVFVVLCCCAIINFYQLYSSQVWDNIEEGMAFDKLIEQFFLKYPDGRLVCVAEEFNSKYCSTAYAYNRYRSDSSMNSLPTFELFDDRVIAINTRPDGDGNWEYPDHLVEELLFKQAGPLFVAVDGGWYHQHLIGLFSVRFIGKMAIWRWLQIGNMTNIVLDINHIPGPGHSFITGTIPLDGIVRN